MKLNEFVNRAKTHPMATWSWGKGKYTKQITAIDKWIKNYSNTHGIFLSNLDKRVYPEVTGYWIETAIKWGYQDLAKSWYKYLVSLQNPDGGWPGVDLDHKSMFFDSGQIIRGIKYYSDFTGIDASATIKKYLKYFDQNFRQELLPQKSGFNLTWPWVNLQIAWIVRKYWPDHVSIPTLRKLYKPYIDKWHVGEQISHFDVYVLEGLYELGLFPQKLKESVVYFDKQLKRYGLLPQDQNNSATCYTASAQLGVLYYKMGKHKEANQILFNMLEALDIKRGNWPGSADGGNYLVGQEISWALKYFLDLLHYYSFSSFDLDIQGEWTTISEPFYAKVADVVIDNTKPGSTILDVGCGLGRYMKQLSGDYRVYGLDISKNNVKYCQSKGLKAGVTSCTVLKLPCNFPKKYDTIYTIEAFEHKVFPINFLKQAQKLLKKNGKIIVIDKDIYECLDYQLMPFESYYSKKEMKKLAKESGLKVTKFSKMGIFLVTTMVKSTDQ